MREIMFRAWDKANNQMVNYEPFESKKTFIGLNGDLGVLDIDNDCEWMGLASRLAYELLQYTGLKDNKGKEIYEGDIIKFNNNKFDLWKVCFDRFDVRDCETGIVIDQVIGWNLKAIKTDVLSTCEPFCYDFPLTNYYIARCEAEVIDNIYENPELLGSD